MTLSRLDAIMFALMVGFGEAYFVADGVRLGSTSVELGLLVGLPLFLGAAGPFVAVMALTRWRRRKPIVLIGVVGQTLVLLSIALLEAASMLAPVTLIALASGYQVFGQTAGVAWSSWYGDVVPARLRGRYFASRNAWAHLATCGAVIGAGFILEWLEPAGAGQVIAGEGGEGYMLIFSLAALARVASLLFLGLSPEQSYAGGAGHRTLFATMKRPEGLSMRRIIGAVGAMQFAVYIGAAYFTPFMLSELHFSYSEYTTATVVVVALKFLSMRAWGRRIDRRGARAVYLRTAMMVALIPLPWTLADGIGLVILAQVLSGLAWGGYEISQFSLLLEAADARIRPPLMAAVNVVNGMAQLLGSVVGSAVMHLADGHFRIVFASTFVARVAVMLLFAPLVPRDRRAPGEPRPRVLLRILGIRPGGGLGHRPIMVDAPPAPTSDLDASPRDHDATAESSEEGPSCPVEGHADVTSGGNTRRD